MLHIFIYSAMYFETEHASKYSRTTKINQPRQHTNLPAFLQFSYSKQKQHNPQKKSRNMKQRKTKC